MREEEKALSRAKIALMSKPDSAFFTSLCFSLKHKFSDEVPTAATNGKEILFSPNFFIALNPEERIFLLLHETMHCAYLHGVRTKALNLDPEKANVAADHVINLQLIERGFKMPIGGLADPKYAGMNMEAIYKLLPEESKPAPWDDLKDHEGDPSELKEDMKDILVRAAIQSKMANDKPGTIPKDIQIYLDRLLKPKLPWKTILRRYLQATIKTDYSWIKTNRRYQPEFILPTMHSEGLMDIAIAIDTSGSVSQKQFTQFMSEVHTILKFMKPTKITIVQFDTSIKAIDEVKNVQQMMKLKFQGRGGTRINEVISWANENKPKLLLVFSDGEFRVPEEKANVNTVWLIHNDPKWKAPWGKVIHYEMLPN